MFVAPRKCDLVAVIALAAWFGLTGSALAFADPPVITTQPTDQTITVFGGNRGTANFTVVASGTEPLSYQWQVSANGSLSWSTVPLNDGTGTYGTFTTGGTIRGLIVSTASATLNGQKFRCVVT